MSLLYLEQVGGVSGDMFLGALAGLGVDMAAMEEDLRRLGLPGLRLEVTPVERNGIPATRVRVLVEEAASGGHAHRACSDILEMIRGSGLPAPVVEKAAAVFDRLATVEGRVHGIPPETVQFHEVGAADSIADIVGSCWGLHRLGVTRLVSSPFLFGHGEVRMAHGAWPVPAPATLLLAEGHPVRFVDLAGETVTPTGAALIAVLASSIGTPGPMHLLRSAAGAGEREWPDRPNILRALLGAADESAPAPGEVEILETAVDDLTPQVAARTVAALLEAGARDAVIVPAIMKKGRPGFQITVVAGPGDGERLAGLLFAESTTLGIRFRRESRWVLPRRTVRVGTPWGEVSVKLSTLPDGSVRVTPEYEECLSVGRTGGVPVQAVLDAARCAARDMSVIIPEPRG